MPPQTPENIDPLVVSYIESEFAKLNSKNKLHVEDQHSGKPWIGDIDHWSYAAAIKATEASRLFTVGVEAELTVLVRRYMDRNLILLAREGPFQ